MADRPRHAWREKIEPGSTERTAWHAPGPAIGDRRSGGRCGCSYQLKVPGPPGATRIVSHRRRTSRRLVTGTISSLRAILAAGVEWGRISSNPAARLRFPAEEHHERQAVERVLDADQYGRLIAAFGTTRIETMIRAAAEAGLRRGEVSA
jgi:integrase